MEENSSFYEGEKSSPERRSKPTKLEPLTAKIIDCIIKVHKVLGPGFPRSVYHNALDVELKAAGMTVESDKELPVMYQGQQVGTTTLDVVVDGQVILALLTVDQVDAAHYAQLRSYLRAAGLEVGLLVNFARERSDFRRVEL